MGVCPSRNKSLFKGLRVLRQEGGIRERGRRGRGVVTSDTSGASSRAMSQAGTSSTGEACKTTLLGPTQRSAGGVEKGRNGKGQHTASVRRPKRDQSRAE
jgi:hypothetical protein